MTELEMYELWRTLRLWANYNQLNQTIEKNWLSNSFNSHILDLLDKEEIKYRSEKRLLGYRNKGKRRLAGNANQPIIINIDDVADVIDVRAEDEFARVELLVSLKQELERLSPRELTCSNRKSNGDKAMQVTLDLFDMDWKPIPEIVSSGLEHPGNGELPKPENLDEMIRIAKILSKDFKFVRVDLYELEL